MTPDANATKATGTPLTFRRVISPGRPVWARPAA